MLVKTRQLLLLCLSIIIIPNIFSAESQTNDTAKPDAIARADTPNAASVSSAFPISKTTRIGSGSVGGNYYVLGELVGGVISHPAGSLPCDKGGTCGIPNLQSQNITTAGSIDNLTRLQEKTIHSGFVQSDTAYWAYTGTATFANKEKQSDLRAIASLYPEAMHIIVRRDANIQSVADFVDKRVSLGDRKSGTLNDARLVLKAYNMTTDDIQAEYLGTQDSIAKLKAGELDAMFFLVGAPAPVLNMLFKDNQDFQLLSIDAEHRDNILAKGHYFSPYSIPANTYQKIGKVETISVYALWLIKADADEQHVYEMTKALWHQSATNLFNSSALGKHIHIDNSLNGIGIPLHPGAKKYYNEIGKRF